MRNPISEDEVYFYFTKNINHNTWFLPSVILQKCFVQKI